MIKENKTTTTQNRLNLDTKISTIVDKIVSKLSPEKIILFGSYAYGKVDEDSDIDLLVVLDTTLQAAERVRMISRLLYPRIAPLDIIVKTPAEIQKAYLQVDPFMHEILAKGIQVYARH